MEASAPHASHSRGRAAKGGFEPRGARCDAQPDVRREQRRTAQAVLRFRWEAQQKHLVLHSRDTLAERLRRRPAKPMGSPRVGSNPTGVVFPEVQSAASGERQAWLQSLPAQSWTKKTKRQRGDSNPCGQSPMDFESISLTARTHCLWLDPHGQSCLDSFRLCRGVPSLKR
jgi:hypothetical protein